MLVLALCRVQKSKIAAKISILSRFKPLANFQDLFCLSLDDLNSLANFS